MSCIRININVTKLGKSYINFSISQVRSRMKKFELCHEDKSCMKMNVFVKPSA